MIKSYLKNRPLSFKTLSVLLIIFCCLAYGCRKDFAHLGQTESEDVLTQHGVDLAVIQKSYNEQVNNKLHTAAVSLQDLTRLVGTLNVDWSTYTLYNNPDSSQTIEFDMPDDNTLMLPSEVAVTDSAKYHGKTSAVFILRKDTVSLGFFMKTIEDGTAPGYQQVLSRVHYMDVPENFSGSVMYFTLSRNFINGYGWDNGNITKTLSISAAPTTHPQINTAGPVKTTALYQTCFTETFELWYTRKSSDGTTVWDEKVGTFTVTSCFLWDDGSGSGSGGTTAPTGAVGSGGGSSNPPPPPPPCKGSAAAASVKGKIVVNVLEGGGTGGTSTPCSIPATPPPPIVNNNLQNQCLKNVLNKLTQGNLTGKIATIIHNVFNTTDKVNLTFEEYTDPNGKPAKTEIPSVDRNNGIFNETIRLNLSQLNGSSQEFAAIIMIHETLHAYFNYNSNLTTQLSQHQEMAEKYVVDIKNLVQQLYPINDADAYAIILNGLSDVFGNNKPAYLQTLATKYHVTDPLGTYESFKQGISGTRCQ